MNVWRNSENQDIFKAKGELDFFLADNGELKRNEDKIEKDYLGNDDYFTNNYDRRNSIK